MLRQWTRRHAKILYGLYRTRLRAATVPYAPERWWDDYFYTQGVSDRQTITAHKHPLSASYHYASVELLILRHLVNRSIPIEGSTVFDIGSGAGHWLDFYRARGAVRCTGIDISARSVEFLRAKYAGDASIDVHHGPFQSHLAAHPGEYGIVNAIGVLFHVVDDVEWRRGLEAIHGALRPGGLLIVGGHFGIIDNANVQFDIHNTANKRLRSLGRWKRTLTSVGFRGLKLYRNRAYLHVRDTLPENNILMAHKPTD